MTTLADRVRKVMKATDGCADPDAVPCLVPVRAALRELVESWPNEKERAEALKVLEPWAGLTN